MTVPAGPARASETGEAVTAPAGAESSFGEGRFFSGGGGSFGRRFSGNHSSGGDLPSSDNGGGHGGRGGKDGDGAGIVSSGSVVLLPWLPLVIR